MPIQTQSAMVLHAPFFIITLLQAIPGWLTWHSSLLFLPGFLQYRSQEHEIITFSASKRTVLAEEAFSILPIAYIKNWESDSSLPHPMFDLLANSACSTSTLYSKSICRHLHHCSPHLSQHGLLPEPLPKSPPPSLPPTIYFPKNLSEVTFLKMQSSSYYSFAQSLPTSLNRIKYELLTIIYKALYGLTSSYLINIHVHHSPTCSLC